MAASKLVVVQKLTGPLSARVLPEPPDNESHSGNDEGGSEIEKGGRSTCHHDDEGNRRTKNGELRHNSSIGRNLIASILGE